MTLIEPSFPDAPDARFIVKIKKLSPNAIIPTKADCGAAGFDLYATQDYAFPLLPGERRMFPTDIAIEIPPGYYGQIAPRSGIALKSGIMTMAGILDETFRGNINVILYNSSNEPFEVKKGQRIAQLIFHKYENAVFREVEQLSDSSRNTGGFGSSGS